MKLVRTIVALALSLIASVACAWDTNAQAPIVDVIGTKYIQIGWHKYWRNEGEQLLYCVYDSDATVACLLWIEGQGMMVIEHMAAQEKRT